MHLSANFKLKTRKAPSMLCYIFLAKFHEKIEKMFWFTLSRKINNHFTNTNMNRGIKDLRRANSFETPTALSKNVAVGSMSFDFHCTNDYYLNDTRTQFVFVQNHISTSENNRSFQQFLSRKLAQLTKIYLCSKN